MSENENKAPRAFKKRYIAVAALSALTIAGGAIGATVTAQSTIKNNTITITEPAAKAEIEVTGGPVKLEFEKGALPETNPTWGYASETVLTVTNKGDADAVLKVTDIPNLVVPSGITKPLEKVLFNIAVDNRSDRNGRVDDKDIFFGKVVSEAPNGEGNFNKSEEITVPANKSVKVVAFYVSVNGLGFNKMDVTDLTFDIPFDYTTKQ